MVKGREIKPIGLLIKKIAGEVTEKGADVAASGAATASRSVHMVPHFELDRPYAFGIIHSATGAPVIRAVIQNPAVLART